MENFARSYKYNCRSCTVRNRCIDAKNLAPGIKIAIAHRFENRTDTFETWDVLQQDCLLVRDETQKKARTASQESALIKRLREARQPSDGPQRDKLKTTPPFPQRKQVVTAPLPLPSPPPAAKTKETLCHLQLVATQRLVRLPTDGDVVLGRFEHGYSNPPDVDLTVDDGEIPSVSRRHALLICRGGQHWLEDMGSSNGTYLNGRQLSLGKSQPLAAGDRILLGRCRLLYTPMPDWAQEPDPRVPHSCFLVGTPTGYEIELPEKSEIMVGRPDPTLDYIPDADLSGAGNIAMHISRRHVRLVAHGGRHFVQEAGSAAGTRLNGRPVRVGNPPALLHPGDQLWLGGCVVAYEWRLL
jgi:pSer/pThr/pTyr-binding forkhead associated (FHA) protein